MRPYFSHLFPERHTLTCLLPACAPKSARIGIRTMAAKAAKPTLESLVHGSLTETCWGQAARRARFSPLTADVAADADVIIVGAGVAGLTAALQLQRAGRDVVLLESKVVGSGRSGRNEGTLTSWKKCQMHNLSGKVAAEAAQSHLAAQSFIKEVVRSNKIECCLQEVDSYIFTHQASDCEALLKKEAAAAHSAGIGSGQILTDVAVGPGRTLDYAYKLSPTLAMDPVRYVDGLADSAVKEGVRIYEQSRVRTYSGKSCTTMEGLSATAKDALVLTTGTPISSGIVDSSVRALAVHSKHVPRRRYAIALALPEDSAQEGVYFDLSQPPVCIRITHSKIAGKGLTLIASGEEHDQGIPAGEFADFHGRLEARIRDKWPQAKERTHHWSYQVFESLDHLSFHGEDPLPGAHYYVSFGDCGEVLASATLGGLIISDQILGKGNKFSQLYSPGRSLGVLPVPPIKPEYVKNAVEAVAGQVLPKLFNPDIEDMAQDSGAIFQKGVRKLAIYKDESDQVHTHSAVCPHLGCLIQWNPAEKQWNCPCHGSCFDKLGGNIGGGPATIDLERLPDAL